MWLYGSGFPKSSNIGLAIDKKLGNESKIVGVGRSGSAETHTRCMNSQTKGGKDVFGGEYEIKEAQNEWKGWGSCLKPSYEPIIVARKPFKGSLVDNVIEYGVGGLNIDECRVPLENGETKHGGFGQAKTGFQKGIGNSGDKDYKCEWSENAQGRFPANTILDTQEGEEWRRYFYCAKASNKDRDEGLEGFEERRKAGYGYDRGYMNAGEGTFKDRKTLKKNIHPTVKPTSLMQYLVRLVAPKNATILDPFMGSGSTGKAIMYENKERNAGYKFIGIEKDADYCRIAEARIEAAK